MASSPGAEEKEEGRAVSSRTEGGQQGLFTVNNASENEKRNRGYYSNEDIIHFPFFSSFL